MHATRMFVGLRHTLLTTFCVGATLVNMVTPALAGPSGEQVAAGAATVSRDGATTVITAANNTIINFQSFNIGQLETVQFIQPDAASRVLNRVTGPGASQIDGTLLANGHVYIANPNGLFFGATALVSTASLTAAAGTITDANFLNNIDHFTGVTGSVMNSGQIQAQMAVNLIGNKVGNFGSIVAPNGMVTMVAGDDVYLSNAGPLMVRVGSRSDDTTSAAVENRGNIDTGAKGKVFMGAADVYALGVRQSGNIRGRDITLSAPQAQVQVTGGLLGAWSDDDTGGSVKVLGHEVVVMGNTTIDASGAKGGGTINIGGSYHGEGPLPNSNVTIVGNDVALKADAKETGDGGRVIVWADDTTVFGGSISARGGAVSGNGGFAEVSGDSLTQHGTYDLTAPHGVAGTLLFDPLSIIFLGGTGLGSDIDFDFFGFLSDGGVPGVVNFNDAGFAGLFGTTFFIYESEIEGPSSFGLNLVLEARASITVGVGESFGDSNGDSLPDLLVPLGSSLTLRTRNQGTDGAGDINLTTGFQGVNLILQAQTGSFITIEGATGTTPAASNIFLSRIIADNGNVRVSTANGSVTAGSSINAGLLGAIELEASANLAINQSLSANAVVLHSAAAGAGAMSFNPGVTINADSITLVAGNGRGGTATAVGNVTNASFRNSAGNSHPVAFAYRQDAAVNDTHLPTVGQFGANVNGMFYSVESSDAAVTVNNPFASKVNGSALSVSGTSVTITATVPGLNLVSLDVVAPGLVTISGPVTTSGHQGFYAPVRLTANTAFTSGSGDITFNSTLDSDAAGTPRNLTLNAGSGDVYFRGLVGGTFALSNLDVTAAQIFVYTTAITSGGAQSYHGPVVLRNDTVFSGNLGLTFDSTISSEVIQAVADTAPDSAFVGGQRYLYINVNGIGQWATAVNGITTIRYDFRNENGQQNNITPAQMAITIDALNKWSDATGGRIVFVRDTAAAATAILNIGVGDFRAIPGTGTVSQPSDLLGIGPSNLGIPPVGNPPLITNARAWLDFAENWDLATGNGTGANGSIDFASVIIHEIGHTLGFSHTTPSGGLPQSVMNQFYADENSTLSAIDISHVQFLYGLSTGSRNVTLTASLGDVVVSGAVSGISNFVATTGGNMSLAAVTAQNILLNANGAGAHNLILNGPIVAAVNFTEGSVTPFGPLPNNGVFIGGSITADTINCNSPFFLTADSIFSGRIGVSLNAQVDAQGHSLSIITDTINIGTIVNSSLGGILTLAPATLSLSVGLNSGTAAFNLPNLALAGISPNFVGVNIGNLLGTGPVLIGQSGAINIPTSGFNLGVRGGAATFFNSITLGSNSTFTLVTNGAGVTGRGPGLTDVSIGGANGRANFILTGAATLQTSVANLSVTKNGAGNVQFTNISPFGTTLQTSSLTAGSLTIFNSFGDIIDAGTVTLAAGASASFTNNAAGGDIILDQLDITGPISLNTTGPGGDATLISATAVNFNASVINGNLIATAGNGSITDNGNVIVTGSAILNATGSIILDNDNDFGSVFARATGGAVNIKDLTGLTILGTSVLAAGGRSTDFTLNAGGNVILEQGGIHATGDVLIATTGKIDALNATNGNANFAEVDAMGNVSLTGAGIGVNQVIDLGDIIDGAVGNKNDSILTVNNTGVAGEGVRINARTDAFATINLTLADSASSASIDLPDLGGGFNRIITVTGGATDSTITNARLNNVDNGAIHSRIGFSYALTEAGAGVLISSLVAGSSPISIATNNGDINDGGVIVVPGALTLSAGSGVIALNAGGDNNFNRVTVLSGGGLSLTDLDDLTLVSANLTGAASVNIAGALNVEGLVQSTTGAFDIAAATADIGVGGGFVTDGDTTVNLTDFLTMGSNARLDAGSGRIFVNTGGDVTLTGLHTTSAAPDAVTVSANAIFDAGDTRFDIDAINGVANLNAPGGIGVGNALELRVGGLAVTTNDELNLNQNGNLVLFAIDTGNHPVLINATGSIDGNAGTPVHILGSDITLNAASIGLTNRLFVTASGILNARATGIRMTQNGDALIGQFLSRSGTIDFAATGSINGVTDDNTPEFFGRRVTLNATAIGDQRTLDVLALTSFDAIATLGDINIDFFLLIPPGSITAPNGTVTTTLSFVTNVGTSLPNQFEVAPPPLAFDPSVSHDTAAQVSDASNEDAPDSLLAQRPSRTATSPAQFAVTSPSTIERLGGVSPREFRGAIASTLLGYEASKAGSLVANTHFDPQEFVFYLMYGSRRDSAATQQDRHTVLAGLNDINDQFVLMGLDGPDHAADRATILRAILPAGVSPEQFEQALQLARARGPVASATP